MQNLKPLFITLMLFTALSISAQTHNVRRGSGSSTNKPSTSTTTKRTTTPSTSKKTGSNSQRHSSTTTSQNKRQTATSSSAPLNPVIQNLVNNMVYVEGGTFIMGGTSEQGSDAYANEKPTHQVTLSSFSIGRYEVTQEEWEAVMGSNPSYFKGAKRPVEQVSWNDCQDFIRRLNSMTGKNFRLPTEAEWEFAARGGKSSNRYKFSGGNDIGLVAWYFSNSGKQTHNVGTKQPNELGLYDMSGNVCEWCSDWHGSYNSSFKTNPKGVSSGSVRVDRGGSWSTLSVRCRESFRGFNLPDSRQNYLGFRLAL